MNALDHWRRDQGLDYQQLAKRLQVNHESASRYCKGRRIPAPVIMRRIYATTAGEVRPDHFYDLPELIVGKVRPDGEARRETAAELGP